jgi:predicted amidohydrolase YtcJ
LREHWRTGLLLILATTLWACAEDPSPQLIVYNGQLLTMDSNTQGSTAFAVKDGLIQHVGDDSAMLALAGPGSELLDLQGQTLVPGFNDAHCHSLGLPPGSVELGDVTDLVELKIRLQQAAVAAVPGAWVIGHGYDDTSFGGHLSRHDLDHLVDDHPVLLLHGSLHLFLVNSMALENAGIDGDTADPHGGFYRRDEQGRLTGLIGERVALAPLFNERQPSPYVGDLSSALAGLDSFMQLALANGITSYSDAMVPTSLALMYWWSDPSELGVRANLMFDVDSLASASILKTLDDVFSYLGWRPFSNPWLRGRTVKLFHGMSLSGRTARMHQAYAGRPDYFGEPPQRSQQQLNAIVAKIHESGFQAAVHANGDYEIDMVLDAYEQFGLEQGRAARHRIEHGSVVDASILQRMAELGVVLAPHSYIYEKGPMMSAYGERRWPWMFANASTFEYGIVNAANSDYPVSALSPLLRIQSLVTRQSRAGKVYGPEQRLTVEQALWAYTRGGAYASFEEDSKGSISPGMYADFVILSNDPASVAADQIHTIEVRATYSAGALRYSAQGSG